jgi:FAD/FMN-containing dehydrogenase
MDPTCIVSATSTQDVSAAIKVLSSLHCSFAIRSGGHGINQGSSNINNGVTIDLSGLNGISVSHDRSTVSVGPGNRWATVYAALDPLNLTVAGGRVASVGVGGLTTGGGISFMSPRVGFTCDTVSNYEVVLADGSIVNANAKQNTDLLIALRGGSNNFGVVTRIDYKAIEQGPFWGGNVLYSITTAPDQLKALVNFAAADTYDNYSSLIMSLTYTQGQLLIFNSMEYTKPVENPAVYQPFMQIPSLQSTMRIDTMTSFTQELDNNAGTGGSRYVQISYYAPTLKVLSLTSGSG